MSVRKEMIVQTWDWFPWSSASGHSIQGRVPSLLGLCHTCFLSLSARECCLPWKSLYHLPNRAFCGWQDAQSQGTIFLLEQTIYRQIKVMSPSTVPFLQESLWGFSMGWTTFKGIQKNWHKVDRKVRHHSYSHSTPSKRQIIYLPRGYLFMASLYNGVPKG